MNSQLVDQLLSLLSCGLGFSERLYWQSCGSTGTEVPADVESLLLDIPYLFHCHPLWAAFSWEDAVE